MTTTYDRLVDQIRGAFIKDAEGRFRVGVLVGKALETGASMKALVDDVGISRGTLIGYSKTAEFWGQDRLAPGTDGKLVVWSEYSYIAQEAAAMDPAQAAKFKRTLIKGGRDEFDRWRRAKYAEWRASRPTNRDPHELLFNSLRQARYYLSSSLNDIDMPPLSAADRRKVRDILLTITEDAAAAGISLHGPVRRVRAA